MRPPRDTEVEKAFAANDRPNNAKQKRSDAPTQPLASNDGARSRSSKSPQSSRVACLLVPALSLAAELRADPELRGRPLAIATASGPRGEVLACSPEAARAGVRVGSGVVHARAACAALTVRVLSLAKERAACEALRDAALACAPRAELAPPATGFYAAEAAVFVDARGIGALHRSEAGFATALAAHAEKLGLPAVVAIADARGTALIAARLLAAEEAREHAGRDAAAIAQRGASDTRTSSKTQGLDAEREAASGAHSEAESSTPREATEGRSAQHDARDASAHACLPSPGPPSQTRARVVAAGGDAAFLAPLALDLLNPEDALADALSRFGLRRVGDLLRTPERALVNRLGPTLLPLLALARGEDSAPPPRAPDARQLEEGTELEAPAAQLEPLLFVLRGLLARLAERLACRGLAFGALGLELALDGGGRDVRTLGLAAPTLDVRIVLRLVALALESNPPGAAVLAASLTTEGAAPRGDQLDFFAPAGPAPSALSRTLADLAALCGPERVGAPALADAHRPDAYAIAPFSLPARRTAPPQGAAPPASSRAGLPARGASDSEIDGTARARGLAVRALRPPLAAAVRSARGVPHWVQSALANGEVVRCAGPWRTTGQWWSEARYAFDHYDVQTSDGNVFRLRRDLVHERWEIDGVFD